MPNLLQVKIRKRDLVATTKGIKTSSPDAIFEALFTKDLKLKKTIGKANKSWQMVALKGSKTTKEESIMRAKNAFLKLLTSPGEAATQTFVFERQTLDCFWWKQPL